MKCKQCGNNYKNISLHWNKSSCNYPEISEKQKEIITGVLMGDGYINKAGNPSICVTNTNRKYLEYLDSELTFLSSKISRKATAEESARHARKTGLSENASEENYSDLYVLNGRKHPELSNFEKWYESGEKKFPEIKLTPKILKHWFCCDGTWHNTNNNNYIAIGLSNERAEKEKVGKMFDSTPVEIARWNEHKRKNGAGKVNCIIEFSVEDSKKVWKWMGNPPKGFEYKWPDKYIYKD